MGRLYKLNQSVVHLQIITLLSSRRMLKQNIAHVHPHMHTLACTQATQRKVIWFNLFCFVYSHSLLDKGKNPYREIQNNPVHFICLCIIFFNLLYISTCICIMIACVSVFDIEYGGRIRSCKCLGLIRLLVNIVKGQKQWVWLNQFNVLCQLLDKDED